MPTIVDATTNEPIALGIQGDNKLRQIRFDITSLISTHGDGTVVLQHKRTSDPVPYAIAYTKTTDSTNNHTYVIWDVTLHDTEQPLKYGQCELRYYVGRALKKSQLYRTYVQADPTGTGVPYPVPPGMLWVDSLSLITKDAQSARDEAVEAKTAAKAAHFAAETAQGLAETAMASAKDSADSAGADAQRAERYSNVARDYAEQSADHASDAAVSAQTAQTALQAMTFVTFATDPKTGHIFVQNGDLLGTTQFILEPATTSTVNAGHLYVNY